jgi:hypothetical protein
MKQGHNRVDMPMINHLPFIGHITKQTLDANHPLLVHDNTFLFIVIFKILILKKNRVFFFEKSHVLTPKIP